MSLSSTVILRPVVLESVLLGVVEELAGVEGVSMINSIPAASTLARNTASRTRIRVGEEEEGLEAGMISLPCRARAPV
jgi:hypothetical protein